MFSLSKRSLSKLEGVHPDLVNVVTLSPTWDGLNIDGVKIKVKMPLTTNKSSDFKFKIGG